MVEHQLRVPWVPGLIPGGTFVAGIAGVGWTCGKYVPGGLEADVHRLDHIFKGRMA